MWNFFFSCLFSSLCFASLPFSSFSFLWLCKAMIHHYIISLFSICLYGLSPILFLLLCNFFLPMTKQKRIWFIYLFTITESKNLFILYHHISYCAVEILIVLNFGTSYGGASVWSFGEEEVILYKTELALQGLEKYLQRLLSIEAINGTAS